MNLAEIRRKAQQQEAEPAERCWQEAPPLTVQEPAPASQPVVEMVPVSCQGSAAEAPAPELPDDSCPPPVLECALEEDLLEPEEAAEAAGWAPAAGVYQEPAGQPLPAVVPPQPAAAAAPAVSVPAVATPAVLLPAAAGRFDPIGAILKGREEASAGQVTGEVAEEESAASLELLCFKVAKEEYAISIMDVKEIIKPRELTEVPRTPPFVGGILSLRGIIIPVFDLRVRLGLSLGEASPRERIVVVKRERGFCGVLVDQVVEVVRLAVAGVEPPPVVLEGIDRDFVQGIGRYEGRMLILLDMEKVLDVTLS